MEGAAGRHQASAPGGDISADARPPHFDYLLGGILVVVAVFMVVVVLVVVVVMGAVVAAFWK